MAFGDFKNIGEVAQQFRIRVDEGIFVQAEPQTVEPRFQAELDYSLANLPVRATEASIREFMIAPILKEAWKPFSDTLTLWVQPPLNGPLPLVGTPDYLISKRSPLGRVVPDRPHLIVMEAKKDDFEGGWGQCLAAMLAAQKLNGLPDSPVYGCVTNGTVWQFGRLLTDAFLQDNGLFGIADLPRLFGAWNFVLSQAREQAKRSAA